MHRLAVRDDHVLERELEGFAQRRQHPLLVPRSRPHPELALRQTSGRFVSRVEQAEKLATEEGREFATLSLADQDKYFDRAKEGRS